MKKIVGVLNPFDSTQSFYFYEDGNRIDRVTGAIDELPEKLITFAKMYNVSDVDVMGPDYFSKGIIKEINNYMITKYNQNVLTINKI